MSDKTKEHIVEEIINEPEHPLADTAKEAKAEKNYCFIGGWMDGKDRLLRAEFLKTKRKQWEVIEKITQFLIDHEGLCYKCMLRNEDDVQRIIEEEHPLDAIIGDIDNFNSTTLAVTGSAAARFPRWIKTIATYVKERI